MSCRISIGCSRGEFGNYKKFEVDGVIGLNSNGNSFIKVLHELLITKEKIFSSCIGHRLGYLSI